MNILKLIVFMTIIAWLVSCDSKQQIQREIDKNDDDLYILEQRYIATSFLLDHGGFGGMMYRSDAPQAVKDSAKKLEAQYTELFNLKNRLKDSIGVVQHIHDSLYQELVK